MIHVNQTEARPDAVGRPRPSRSAGARSLAAAGGLLAAILAATIAPSGAQTLPALTGRVVDGAGLLDPAAEAALTQTLAAFEAKSSDQIVVATVPDLQGYAIEEFGVALGRGWKIGREGENNGAILLVSSGDRKVRIEVGYGLEGTLTDALARTIIETDIVPAFKSGDYAGGIARGAEGMIAVLSGDAAELEARATRNKDWSGSELEGWVFFAVFFGIFALTICSFVMAFMARRFGRKVGRNQWRWLGVVWSFGSGLSAGSGFGSSRGGFSSGSSGGGGFSGGGGSFGGGGSSGSW